MKFMGRLQVTLISGRSTKQGVGISAGKEGKDYGDATGVIELNPVDMKNSGLEDGRLVRIASGCGEVDVRCRCADVPEGLAFMAFGPACNRLVGGETHASGMPDSKHLQVEITTVNGMQHRISLTGNGKS
ncbi:MAG: molybdopterin dinucleotide binding domain-containing protein [Acidobacteriota bacterium]|jgi:formylmethanofuran dehydrogenase subunit D